MGAMCSSEFGCWEKFNKGINFLKVGGYVTKFILWVIEIEG